jgi:hypothetical protein
MSKVGDRGVIERFSTRPVLLFMTPEAKAAVLDRPYLLKRPVSSMCE